MHELSIALNIVDIVSEEARKNNANSVDKVVLEIGTLAGVEMQAFSFAWNEAITDTVLSNAEKQIVAIEGLGLCKHCGKEFKLIEKYTPCPECGVPGIILKGDSLRIKSIHLTN